LQYSTRALPFGSSGFLHVMTIGAVSSRFGWSTG
jgi:hypothetical protein